MPALAKRLRDPAVAAPIFDQAKASRAHNPRERRQGTLQIVEMTDNLNETDRIETVQ